jgi:D-glycero-D-manno-heptose 1,7-bisphosphate phosphatase
MRNRAVFVDRDGTINANIGYINDPKNLKIYPSVAKGIKILKENGFKIIVITNQSGITRGFFSEGILEKIHQKMRNELSKKGASIDAIYYCPHHPDDGCNCRKPNIGLFKKAIKELNIDVKHSFIIGDRMLDVEAGYKIGCKTILVPENKEKVEKEMRESNIEPDYICDDFYSGVKWILRAI